MKYNNDKNNYLQAWQQSEALFMRFVGAAAIVIAVGIIGTGMLVETSDNLSTVFNLVAGAMFGLGGAWSLWVSFQEERMDDLMTRIPQRSLTRTRIMAGVQIATGVLFFLNGGIAWLLIGGFTVIIGGWFLRRSLKMQEYQQLTAGR